MPSPPSNIPLIDELQPLLPLRGMVVTLELIAPARLMFFHQAALHAFVRHLAGSPEGFDRLITLDAPESGRTRYRRGDRYRFTLIGLPGSEPLLARLIGALKALPESAPVRDPQVPLRNNLRLTALHDLFGDHNRPIAALADLCLYDSARLAAELALWRDADFIFLELLSPARLLKAKAHRQHQRGEARYCRDLQDLTDGVLAARLHDSLAHLLRQHGAERPPRRLTSPRPSVAGDLFWIDSGYRDAAGKTSPVGGLCGRIALGPGAEQSPDWLAALVLGQYLGIGQRRVFGLGRYRLIAPQGWSTARLADPAAGLLAHAARDDLLYDAYLAMRANQSERTEQDPDAQPPDPEDEEQLADRLERLSLRLKENRYRPPELHGLVIREADGDLRGLAIPTFWDRVAQRAVNDQLLPACELIWSDASHGYRRGRSRHSAGDAIRQAYADGYRWIYEADIDDFFDSVDWQRLANRLRALYRDDPVVELLLAWMAAPVSYQGFPIQRTQGLPQGAPLSPTLANLMLDEFDNDLTAAGFRLVRYADDFVVLCKSRDQAEAAGEAVRASLADLGLDLNEEKSRAVSFEQGFRFLGFLFMNDLVLDVGGRRGEQRAAPKPPPPASWLSRIGQRPAAALDQDGKPSTPKPPAPNADTPMPIGERHQRGMLLLVAGRSALVSTREGRVQVTRDDQPVADHPWRSVDAVLLLGGSHHITTPALRAAMAADVPVHFASAGGHYQGVAWSAKPAGDGAALWLDQRERFARTEWSIRAARALVMARARHMREHLRQRAPQGLHPAREALTQAIANAGRATDRDQLNGIEGSATRACFAALAQLVPDDYGFDGRNRRPPRDPFNALLSLGYSLLHANCLTLIRISGLYPWLGLYHVPHGGHAALASDLMEPFRHLIERAALTALTRGMLTPEDFRNHPEQGCRLTPVALRRYLALVWERLDQPVTRLGESEPKPALQQLHAQNQRLIDAIRGGGDFEPFVAQKS